jgi:hypothetical protein
MVDESGPPDDHKPAGRGRFWTFWTTLPGILTGVAALITAMISLFTVFHTSGHGLSGTAASTRTTRFMPSSESTSATALVSQAPGVLAQGQLSQRPGENADLEGGRVGNGVASGDLSLLGNGVGGGVYELTSLGGPLAPLDGGTVDKAACTAALNAHSDGYEYLSQFHVGSALCVDTSKNHVAALRIISLPGVGDSRFVYDYTVWQ